MSLVRFKNAPSVKSYAAVVGRKEGEGPLGEYFDIVRADTTFGQKSWECAESELQRLAWREALKKGGYVPSDIDLIFGGDLQNQCTATHYSMRDEKAGFVGIYGACSTMALSLALAAQFVDSGAAKYAAAVTSSHFCAAERQFRFPLEYGSQRTPTAQWTVTGSGCVIVGESARAPFVRAAYFGKIIDYGIKDINNMGAAMAPAAADTILGYLNESGLSASDFDMIVTGDLGKVGSELLRSITARQGVMLHNHFDCGTMIYDDEHQRVKAGGSGCGCGASVLCGYLLDRVKRAQTDNILFIATGALMSPTTFQQKESIPAIAHLLHLSYEKENV